MPGPAIAASHMILGCSTVREAAKKMKQRPIDVLVNNASVAAPKDDLGGKTVDGFEVGLDSSFGESRRQN